MNEQKQREMKNLPRPQEELTAEAQHTQGGFNPQPEPPRFRLVSYSFPGSQVMIQDEESRVL
jgi:hypothetical protein